MFIKKLNIFIKSHIVRTCHHSNRLEEYQLVGLCNKLVTIEKKLADISKDIVSIEKLINMDKPEKIISKNLKDN